MTSPKEECRPPQTGTQEVHHDSTTSVPPLDPKRVPPAVAPILRSWIGDLVASVAHRRDSGQLRPCKHRAKLTGWPCHWVSWWPEYLFCSTCTREALKAAQSAGEWPCLHCGSKDASGSALVIPVSGGSDGLLNVGFIVCPACRAEVVRP